MLEPGVVVPVHVLGLVHESLPPAQIVAGAPTTAWMALGDHGEVEIGVWEMTPGTASDIEVDEVFVVVSGRARVDFVAPILPSIELAAGDVVRLTAGMQTVWTVTETLRKVSIA